MNKCKFSNNCFTGGTHHCNHFNNRFCHGGWRGETSGSGVMRHRINGAFYETLVLFHTIQIYTYIAFWTNGRKKMHKMKNIYIYIFRDNNLLLNLSKTETLMVNNSFYSIVSSSVVSVAYSSVYFLFVAWFMHQSHDDRSSDTFGNYSWEWSVRLVISYRPSILLELSLSYEECRCTVSIRGNLEKLSVNDCFENWFSSVREISIEIVFCRT